MTITVYKKTIKSGNKEFTVFKHKSPAGFFYDVKFIDEEFFNEESENIFNNDVIFNVNVRNENVSSKTSTKTSDEGEFTNRVLFIRGEIEVTPFVNEPFDESNY